MRTTLAFAVLVWSSLPAQDSRGAPDDAEVRAAIAQATQLLCGMQENYVEAKAPRTRFKNDEERAAHEEKLKAAEAEKSKEIGPPREWPYEGVVRVAGLIPSGYRVGGTAICCWALLESPDFDADAARRETFLRGIRFILEALSKDPLLQTGFDGTYDVRGWGHTYGLIVLLRAHERRALPPDVAKRAHAMIRELIKTLVETEIPGGGWNYARSGGRLRGKPSTFMTAPTLQAFFSARKLGFDVPDDVVERGLKTLEDARFETGAFQYGTASRKSNVGAEEGFDAVAGACARMAVCETTLALAGRCSEDRIRTAVAAFFENWEWLEQRRKKTGTHVPPYMIAPYYFHFAHTYVSQAIEMLPEAERPPLRQKLRALYWQTREKSGGWNDRVFPRSEGYGTAMAILGLMMPELPPPARWQPKAGTTTRTVK
jgi:hypothetical protein